MSVNPNLGGSTSETAAVEHAGYKEQFARTLGKFESFAVAFSFISITTGLFSTYGIVLASSGPIGIWTWPIATAGTVLVALVYGMLASRIPLSGYSYQWASRLAGPRVGWVYGWMSFAFLSLVTVAVDYGLSQAALVPLFNLEYTPLTGAVITGIVLLIQMVLIIWSTPITTKINNMAVGAEIIAMIGLTVLIGGAVLFGGKGDIGNLTSLGGIPAEGYYSWLGPFMLSALLGCYTLVGWETAANLAEETVNAKKVVPTAMVRAVLLSGVVGMAFLMAISAAIGNVDEVAADASPVALIISQTLGEGVKTAMLVVVSIAIFACGLVIMVANSRLIHAMACDGRLPGASVLARVPRPTGGPTFATILGGGISILIVISFGQNPDALGQLLGAATLMPAILYAGTVGLYIATRNKFTHHPDDFTLGKWEWPVVIGAAVWLLIELAIFVLPEAFRTAQQATAIAIGIGLVIMLIMNFTNKQAFEKESGLGVDKL